MGSVPGTPPPETPYQVVARRFRPQTFGEMVGQDDVLKSLRLALQQHKVPHAFLFSGSRGVGKTTSARILARCLNCVRGPTPEPCGECPACRSILDGSNPDVIEIDAASNNGVDDVRSLREHLGYATMQSRYRVVILDEAHMMSKGAFNALLKTLEEPPPQVVFVLATTEMHKLPDTIVSRCQVLLFRRVGEPDLMRRLRTIADRDGVAVPDAVLAEIAQSVHGGVRDAETALERVLPVARELGPAFDLAAYRTLVAKVGLDRAVEVVEALLAGDVRAGLAFAREQEERGIDQYEALGELVEVLRWLLLLQADGPDSGSVQVAGALRERLVALAKQVSLHQLDALLSAGLKARTRLREGDDRSAVFEVALVRMAQAGALPTLADLLAEVRAGGGFAAAATAAPAAARPQFGKAATSAGAGPAPTPPRPGAGTPAGGGAPAAAGAPPPGGDLKARVKFALKERGLLQATLDTCRFDGPGSEGKVVVTTTATQRMHLDRLASPDVQRELTQTLVALLGPVQVEFRLPSSAAGAPGAAAATPPAKVSLGETGKRVLGQFRGRVVEVNPTDRPQPSEPVREARDEPAPGAEPELPEPQD
ncbi:MAG: DNA polymerase III subunit gamma/tau [Planctomycetes bacterium]|nr:DNA polymerase III subunit gamma/tau [Planctomycetota bacterium]